MCLAVLTCTMLAAAPHEHPVVRRRIHTQLLPTWQVTGTLEPVEPERNLNKHLHLMPHAPNKKIK